MRKVLSSVGWLSGRVVRSEKVYKIRRERTHSIYKPIYLDCEKPSYSQHVTSVTLIFIIGEVLLMPIFISLGLENLATVRVINSVSIPLQKIRSRNGMSSLKTKL